MVAYACTCFKFSIEICIFSFVLTLCRRIELDTGQPYKFDGLTGQLVKGRPPGTHVSNTAYIGSHANPPSVSAVGALRPQSAVTPGNQHPAMSHHPPPIAHIAPFTTADRFSSVARVAGSFPPPGAAPVTPVVAAGTSSLSSRPSSAHGARGVAAGAGRVLAPSTSQMSGVSTPTAPATSTSGNPWGDK
jgi:hypothetical protein